MILTDTIGSAELKFKQILEEFFIGIYDEKSLPSHGIWHHRRVWTYAKEVLTLFAGYDSDIISRLSSKLIISTYLHDIGMSVETGIKHGRHSRDLCIQFLNTFQLPENEYRDVLYAIENHDNKDYERIDSSVNELLTILSVADDIDALGFTGIFRYAEIYLTRGIKPEDISYPIRQNAGKRFDNLSTTLQLFNEFVRKHNKRYDLLDGFFEEYGNQAGSYQFGRQEPSGHCGVVDMINETIRKKESFKSLLIKPMEQFPDKIIRWFIDGLREEMYGCLVV